jgi:hypothetical protein
MFTRGRFLAHYVTRTNVRNDNLNMNLLRARD